MLTRSRTKRIVILSLVMAIAIVSGLVYQSSNYLLESWHLYRLDDQELSESLETVAALGNYGSERAADRLSALAADDRYTNSAMVALRQVLPRISSHQKEALVRSLLAMKKEHIKNATDLQLQLYEIGKEHPDLLPVFAERLSAKGMPERIGEQRNAARVIAKSWTSHRNATEALLEKLSVEQLQPLLEICCQSQSSGRLLLLIDPSKAPDIGIEMAVWLSERRDDPEAHALAMSFAALKEKTQGAPGYDLTPVLRAWEEVSSPLVRRAALRVAGFLGYQKSGLDLRRIVLEENDPELLTEAIQARTLWANRPTSHQLGFELWDGFTCDWIPAPSGKEVTKAWDSQELARLKALLHSEKHPPLRDACSLVLASRYRNVVRSNHSDAPDPILKPDLRVHEWGVWLDVGSAVIPPRRVFADLPEFVHRSKVSAITIRNERYYSPTPMIVTKPVVFFHCPEPVSLLVRANFHQGSPWTFFPAATDYTIGPTLYGNAILPRPGASSNLTVAPPGEDTMPGPLSSELLGLDKIRKKAPPSLEKYSLRPPQSERESTRRLKSGMRTVIPGLHDSTPEKLRAFYYSVPWLVPNHPPRSSQTRGGPVGIASIGLEWCGLRVGYPDGLEADWPEVEPDSWWRHLRKVPSANVAVRGESDRCLFYDGAVDFPGPLLASWSWGDKSELLLKLRRFEDFPLRKDISDWWWLSDDEKARLTMASPVPAVMIIDVPRGSGRARGLVLENLRPEDDPLRLPLTDLQLDQKELEEALTRVLERQGLSSEEARSLILTWQDDFFWSEGLRAITVLPQWMYDALVPLEVYPVPGEVVRVGLVLKELDQIGIGPEPLGHISREERWRPSPWRMPKEPIEIPEEELRLEGETALPMGESGELQIPGRPSGVDLSPNGSFLSWLVLEGSTCRVLWADLGRKKLLELAVFDGVSKRPPGGTSISADGNRVAYSVSRKAYLVDLREKARYALPFAACPLLSDDASRLLSNEINGLQLLDLVSGRLQTLFELEDPRPAFSSTYDLSGDGGTASFAFGLRNDSEVYVIDLKRETILNVSRSRANDRAPSLSYNGRRIVFEGERLRNHDIYLADLDQKSLKNLTRNPLKDRMARLSADGDTVKYYDEKLGNLEIDLGTLKRRDIDGEGRMWPLAWATKGARIVVRGSRGYERYLRILDIERNRSTPSPR